MASQTLTLENLDIKKGKLSYKTRTALIKDVFSTFLRSKNKKDLLKFSKILKMFRQEYAENKSKLNQIIKLFLKKHFSEHFTPDFYEAPRQIFKNNTQNLKLINRNV